MKGVIYIIEVNYMRNTIIKLKSIELENFKNVEQGKIEFKEDKTNNTISNILGIYGQNGSGKTSIINALYLLKLATCGQELGPKVYNFIASKEDSAVLNFEFRMFNEDEEYKVFYKFEIRKVEKYKDNYMNPMNEIENHMDYNMKSLTYNNKKEDTVEISKEKLSYSKLENNQWKNRVTIIDYDVDYTDYAFRPIKNYREVANTTDKKVALGIAKGLSQENSTSYIFIPKSFSLLVQSFGKTNVDNSKIISGIRNFGTFNLFVIQNDDLCAINSNVIMPFTYMIKNDKGGIRGNIPVKLFDTSVIEIDRYETMEKILSQINVVISTIVPKLNIEIKNYGKETLKNGIEGYKVELLSTRGENSIPLKYESDGIKKIISILSVLIAMYNNENVIVAIDELDAGVFEYLLGEILEIISKGAKGQLIFTSHNLRALEKLNKDLVVFTTTNPRNRYISLSNVKGTNNLRDFYYRGLILGGQKEELYDETNKYEMSHAFRKAWMMNND